ncbi:MAG TPA: type II toxin-antitoxin system ParD family antitoxin [Rhodanobacter sp.]|nr:type II toxin-antitoxin system ParD family antitoxin [Rhodanobacter sp.]
MPATMNISLTEPLKRFVDQQVRDGGFSSTSDYVRELIRDRQKRNAEEHLRGLIAEGLASGPAVRVDDAWFRQARKRARDRTAK